MIRQVCSSETIPHVVSAAAVGYLATENYLGTIAAILPSFRIRPFTKKHVYSLLSFGALTYSLKGFFPLETAAIASALVTSQYIHIDVFDYCIYGIVGSYLPPISNFLIHNQRIVTEAAFRGFQFYHGSNLPHKTLRNRSILCLAISLTPHLLLQSKEHVLYSLISILAGYAITKNSLLLRTRTEQETARLENSLATKEDDPFFNELKCPIKLGIPIKPVLDPTAFPIIYDESAILTHFQKNGFTSPVSRKPLKPEQLINLTKYKALVDSIIENPDAELEDLKEAALEEYNSYQVFSTHLNELRRKLTKAQLNALLQ